MFGLGFTEILVILVVALLVFGPEKLPEIARGAGRTIGEFRRVLDDMKREFSISALTTIEPQEHERLKPTAPPAEQPPAEKAVTGPGSEQKPPEEQ